jgi:hypothetical protein
VKTSEQTADLIGALVKAHPKFTAITKSKTAKAGQYSYDYADLHALLRATMPALLANGVTVTQAPDWDDDLSSLVLVTTLWHTSGQWLSTRYPLKTYDQPQQMGGAITYAKRYCLGALLAVAAEDEDDDAQAAQAAKPVDAPAAHARLAKAQDAPAKAASSEKPAPPAGSTLKGKTISEAQQKRFFAIAKAAGWSNDDIKLVLKSKWNLDHTSEIGWSAYDSICAFFKQPPDQVAEEDYRAEQLAEDDVEYRQREAEDNATRHAKPSAAAAEDMPF